MFESWLTWRLAVFALGVLFFCSCSAFKLLVNPANGAFKVTMNDGDTWLSSPEISLHVGGQWYSTRTKSLPLSSFRNSTGHDGYGDFEAQTFVWNAGGVPYVTQFRLYSYSVSSAKYHAVVFSQQFPKGATNIQISSPNASVLSVFPSITTRVQKTLRYATYSGTFAIPSTGLWSNLNTAPELNTIQGGPIRLSDGSGQRVILISPAKNFGAAGQLLSNGVLRCGILGTVLKIPAGFVHETLLVAGARTAGTFAQFGKLMVGEAKTVNLTADIGLRSLSYWTDNGAYYYYNTEPNKNYAQTMIDVYNATLGNLPPFKNWQFDSWWYLKGPTGGVSLWEPMQNIFPSGMKAVDSDMGNLPLTLHNRWFDPATKYLSMGFKNSFIVETNNGVALPIKQDVFKYIMGKAKSWGMVTYEQDWLVTTYVKMNATQNSVSNVADWLGAMDASALSLGLTVQYCMALPLHILASSKYKSVTQIRASDDYQPGNAQWRIAYASQLIWAVGAVPFKDTFWSGDGLQAGCPYASKGGCVEPNAALELLVAAFSNGPVGPSDLPWKLNDTRLNWVSDSSGNLFKSDYPARPLELAWDASIGTTPTLLDLTMTENKGVVFVLAANLPMDVPVRPADFDVEIPATNYLVVDWFLQTRVGTSNASHPFVIPAANDYVADLGNGAAQKVDFNFYLFYSSYSTRRWSCLGDFSKIIVTARIQEVAENEFGEVVADAIAPHGDEVHFGMYDAKEERIHIVKCTSGVNGSAKAVCSNDGACICRE